MVMGALIDECLERRCLTALLSSSTHFITTSFLSSFIMDSDDIIQQMREMRDEGGNAEVSTGDATGADHSHIRCQQDKAGVVVDVGLPSHSTRKLISQYTTHK